MGRKFQPGQSGNPKGRPKKPDWVRSIEKLTNDEIKALFSKFARMTKSEIEGLTKDPDATIIELMIARQAHQAVAEGNLGALNVFLDRTVGKVTDKVELKKPTPTIIARRDGTEIQLGVEE